MSSDRPYDPYPPEPSAAVPPFPPAEIPAYGEPTGVAGQDAEGPLPAPKKGRSAGCILGIILLIFLFLILLCCGVLAFSILNARSSLVDDPTEVRARADAMLRMELPDEFHPLVAMKVNFVGFVKMDMAVFEDSASNSTLMLMGYGGLMGQRMLDDQSSQAALRQQSQTMLQEQGMESRHEGLTQETHVQDITVLGSKVQAQVIEFTDSENNLKRLHVLAMIPTERQAVVVLFDVNAEHYPEERLLDILKNAQPPTP